MTLACDTLLCNGDHLCKAILNSNHATGNDSINNDGRAINATNPRVNMNFCCFKT